MIEDFEQCYRAVASRDDRFDGWFFTAVTSTGIYCRPSCPARTPRHENVRFFATAAAAQGAGFRACRRCRPDATPGSPQWNLRSDVVARALRLIADGLIDRQGVTGLARHLGYSERQLHRQLVAEVGVGALALARAQRAQSARILIETTDVPLAGVAFAAGFASVRQFNDTVQAVFACTPSQLRARGTAHGTHGRQKRASPAPGTIVLRLAYRRPFDGRGLLRHYAGRAVTGVEEVVADCGDWEPRGADADGGAYRRALALPHGSAVVALTDTGDHVRCQLHLADLRDLTAAVQRCRLLWDLDADPVAVAQVLGADPMLAPLVAACPGRRVAQAADGAELALRAVLGQQVSIAGARRLAVRLVERHGKPLTAPVGTLTHLFPDAATLAAVDPAALPLPRARATSLVGLAEALAAGTLVLDRGADRGEAQQQLRALPGVGPWTAAYVAMRALGDPDAFPVTDLGLRRSAAALDLPSTPSALAARAAAWRPWRAYAAAHLWAYQPGSRHPLHQGGNR